jgi:hypothetical protein
LDLTQGISASKIRMFHTYVDFYLDFDSLGTDFAKSRLWRTMVKDAFPFRVPLQ